MALNIKATASASSKFAPPSRECLRFSGKPGLAWLARVGRFRLNAVPEIVPLSAPMPGSHCDHVRSISQVSKTHLGNQSARNSFLGQFLGRPREAVAEQRNSQRTNRRDRWQRITQRAPPVSRIRAHRVEAASTPRQFPRCEPRQSFVCSHEMPFQN